MAGLLDLLRKEGGQYLRDIMPGGMLNPEWTPERTQMALSGLLDVTPVVGDIKSGYEGVQAARQGDMVGAGLGALGALPFIPNMAGIVGKVAKEAPRAEAMRIAQKNAAKPISEGGLGLKPDNTPMDRAKTMGFDMDVYHGSPDISKTTEFDPAKIVDNVQYGGKFYSSTDPAYAGKYAENSLRGDSAGVMPLMMRSGKRFEMDKPVSADDAAKIMESLGQTERAAKIRASGRPYRNGAELFYFGLDSGMSNAPKGDAILRSGFDSIHGDPMKEIVGKAGKPHSVVSDPSRLRSRFAAFDPARRMESDLLGQADPRLLALIAGGGMLGVGLSQD
jgi:hypothetical protein